MHYLFMRLLIGCLIAVLLASCKAHAPPDDVATTQIRSAVVVTMSAMGLPADQQPDDRSLSSQSRLLACRLSPERLSLLRGGALDRQAVIDGYHNTLKRRAAKQSTAQAPTLLVFLIEKSPTWSVDQTMLAAALLAQFEDEAKLALPTTNLAQ